LYICFVARKRKPYIAHKLLQFSRSQNKLFHGTILDYWKEFIRIQGWILLQTYSFRRLHKIQYYELVWPSCTVALVSFFLSPCSLILLFFCSLPLGICTFFLFFSLYTTACFFTAVFTLKGRIRKSVCGLYLAGNLY